MTESSPGPLCRVDDIADPGVHEVHTTLAGANESLLLLRSGEQVRAYLNVCPHAGRQLNWAPGKFLLESGLLICAVHGASFNIPDGRCVMGPCRGASLSEVALRIDQGAIHLAD